jgi:hypothetical protein
MNVGRAALRAAAGRAGIVPASPRVAIVFPKSSLSDADLTKT